MKRISVGIMILLLTSLSILALNVQPTKAWSGGTIYIRSDGSVDPSDAPIQRDGDIYTLTGNINDSIVVEKDNIIVDGVGYTVQGTGNESGIDLTSRSNVTIKNTEIKAFEFGINLWQTESTFIYGNNVTSNRFGIDLLLFKQQHPRKQRNKQL